MLPQRAFFIPDCWLKSQTLAVRTAMALHRESRAIALQLYPDTLDVALHCTAKIYFSKTRDIIFLDHVRRHKIHFFTADSRWASEGLEQTHAWAFCKQVVNLGLGRYFVRSLLAFDRFVFFSSLIRLFRSIEKVFILQDLWGVALGSAGANPEGLAVAAAQRLDQFNLRAITPKRSYGTGRYVFLWLDYDGIPHSERLQNRSIWWDTVEVDYADGRPLKNLHIQLLRTYTLPVLALNSHSGYHSQYQIMSQSEALPCFAARLLYAP